MMKKLVIAVCLGVFCLFNIHAQKIAEVSLTLQDGNVIKGMSLFNDVELQTDYGKLVIPIANISNVAIGVGKDNASISQVVPLLKLLNTSLNEEARKSAYNDLVKVGPKALYTIEQFLSDPKNSGGAEYSGTYTIDGAVTEIRSQANLSDDTPYLDVLTIDNHFTMGGIYTFGKLDVKTEYGTLSIPKEKIKSMDISVWSPPSNGEFSFRLQANKHISGNQNGGWLKTGIHLKTGQGFQISATGEVILASLSNGKYKPDGTYAPGNGAGTNGEEPEYTTGTGITPVYGQVVYKIGEATNEPSKAGKKFSGSAKQSGMLYLSIYETVYNPANTGSYIVKVQAVAK